MTRTKEEELAICEERGHNFIDATTHGDVLLGHRKGICRYCGIAIKVAMEGDDLKFQRFMRCLPQEDNPR